MFLIDEVDDFLLRLLDWDFWPDEKYNWQEAPKLVENEVVRIAEHEFGFQILNIDPKLIPYKTEKDKPHILCTLHNPKKGKPRIVSGYRTELKELEYEYNLGGKVDLLQKEIWSRKIKPNLTLNSKVVVIQHPRGTTRYPDVLLIWKTGMLLVEIKMYGLNGSALSYGEKYVRPLGYHLLLDRGTETANGFFGIQENPIFGERIYHDFHAMEERSRIENKRISALVKQGQSYYGKYDAKPKVRVVTNHSGYFPSRLAETKEKQDISLNVMRESDNFHEILLKLRTPRAKEDFGPFEKFVGKK